MWLTNEEVKFIAAAAVVGARVDAKLKRDATTVLSGMGLSVSDAIRMTLVRLAAEQAFPFEVGVPNRLSQEALGAAEKDEGEHFDSVAALMADLEGDEG